MQPIRHATAVFWAILLFQLAACSHQPVAVQRQSAGEPAPDPARHVVIATARDMLGKPYRYGGTSPRGFDCSGLVWYSHRQAGIAVPRTARKQMSAAQPVEVSELIPGDLVFFKIDTAKSYHVGIYLGDGTFIPAPSSGGTVSRASLENRYWHKRLVGTGNYYQSVPTGTAPF